MPLIIYRYLSRQMLQVMLAITAVVLLIIMSGRFANYVAQAATGTLKAEFLFAIMGYRIPEFLVMILPLGLFLGIILAYGRLYVDNEMTVLSACGLSRNQLFGMTLLPSLMVMVVVGVLSLWIAPAGVMKVGQIFDQQDSLTEFDTLVPGRFQNIGKGQRVTYAESLSDDKQQMNQVFIANRNTDSNNVGAMTILVSESGKLEENVGQDGRRYLLLKDGYRYDLTPGILPIRETLFSSYGFRMEQKSAAKWSGKEQALPTAQLINSDKLAYRAELQWRLSLPLLIPVIVLLALPLAQVNPRQGRYVKLLPGILLYLFYLSLLMSGRGAIEDGRLPVNIGLWPIHGLFLLIALTLYFFEPGKLWLSRRRARHA
ncbi:LPS export ABC transporter permease LptF [Endozoicomonas ascidiicola]|uniref:LPS export ABC transporter permease LptF n=1 Tax=Endozoicomonas ascidiicola TaxID=1698521 RepID=UPI000831A0AD|nr:LPS export ABC transporter permease LptF [Endozoicomonas ascidiicola]